MPSEIAISFRPAQPCMTWNGVESCGKPATVARISYYARRADFFAICQDCATATLELYAPMYGTRTDDVSGNE